MVGIPEPADRGRVREVCNALAARLRRGDIERVLCEPSGSASPTCGTVDALARIRLVARRQGCDVGLLRAAPELLDLLALAGLDELLPLEPRRQLEEGEERLGVEEEGDAAEPPP